MICIHTLLTGQPHTHTAEHGSWYSAIYRSVITDPVELGPRGLAGDQVGDTKNHGSPDQAVCCNPLVHYAYWNDFYGLTTPDTMLGPGSIGENWTLEGTDEAEVCVGDIFAVSSARVQVSAPRYPCSKQERKLGLPGFLRQTKASRRTGFYLRVLTPGTVQAGDTLTLEARPQPDCTIERINACEHAALDVAFAQQLLDVPELAAGWKRIVRGSLSRHHEAGV